MSNKSKSKKKKLYTSIICSVMVVVTLMMGILSFADEKADYKTGDLTYFHGRVWLGGKSGTKFMSQKRNAKLVFDVKGESKATRATCYVYVLKKHKGNYYVIGEQTFTRPIKPGCAASKTITLNFEIENATEYSYVFSVYKLPQENTEYGKIISKWPDTDEDENRVKYPFIINEGMKLYC